MSIEKENGPKAAAIKAGAHDQVDSFCGLLKRHIRTEVRQLFVLAENRMKPAEMAELGGRSKRSSGQGRSLALADPERTIDR